MARLRVFVSSTYYDLRHIRSSMEGFIEGMGYEPVLFESGDIPFHHDISLADACYKEVNNSHLFVLIVGGRYGSAADERMKKATETEIERMYETYNSVTKKEYETARAKDIPIFIFVEKGVRAEYETFKSNRDNTSIKYAHVDSVNIFRLLDEILNQKRNNFVKDFEKFEEIMNWLKDQWAGIFSDLLSKKNDSSTLKDMSAQIFELGQVTKSMKEYTESIMRKVQPDNFEQIIHKEATRLKTSRIRRFMKEEMIDYVAEENRQIRLVPSRMFSAFEMSTSLEDFLKRIKVPDDFIYGKMLDEHKDIAQRDYARIKQVYFDEPQNENDVSELNDSSGITAQ